MSHEAHNKKGKSMRSNLRILGCGLALVAWLGASHVWADDLMLTVHLDSDGCPVYVASAGSEAVNTVTATRGKDKIGWLLDDSTKQFWVYFSPFSPPAKGRQGTLKPRPVPHAQAAVEYKYSVVVEGCEHSPLDPRIIVKE